MSESILKRKHIERALELRNEDLGWRKIHKRLKEKFDDYKPTAYTTLYKWVSPILEEERSLDETVDMINGKKSVKKENQKGNERISEEVEEFENMEVNQEEDTGENKRIEKIIGVILWLTFLILFYLSFI